MREPNGWRTATAYVVLVLGLVTLAMTLPAMVWLGWGALYLVIPGFTLVAAGIVLLIMLLARATRGGPPDTRS